VAQIDTDRYAAFPDAACWRIGSGVKVLMFISLIEEIQYASDLQKL